MTKLMQAAIILASSDGISTPLVACYPLFIAASGLWFRVPLVWFATALSAVSFLTVVVKTHVFHPDIQNRFDFHFVFLTCELVLGFIIAHQVRRVRTLSRYADK